MAGFGRSNSLSINTGGGLFGSNATAQQQSQPQSSGGLFSTAQQTQQPQTTSLFGGSQLQTQTQTTQPQSGGLFGSLNKPATAAAPSTGLFGASTTQSQVPTKPSLFGNSTQPSHPVQQPSLFGSTQQPQQNTLFGGMNSQSRPTPLGGSAFGGAQPSSGSQPVQMTMDSIRGTTRFNDLHPEIQALIQQFDEGIQRKISYCNQIRETLPTTENDIGTIAPDVDYVETFLSTVEVGLDNDSANIAHLKALTKADAEDATLSFRAIENQRLPAQFHYRNSANLSGTNAKTPASVALDEDSSTKPVDLMGYFDRRTDELGQTLSVYQQQIREIEAHLRTMEAGTIEKAQQLTGSRSAPRDQRRELVDALKAIEGAILDSARKVGQVRDEVTKHTMGSVGAALL